MFRFKEVAKTEILITSRVNIHTRSEIDLTKSSIVVKNNAICLSELDSSVMRFKTVDGRYLT